jgi:hypothetical protein
MMKISVATTREQAPKSKDQYEKVDTGAHFDYGQVFITSKTKPIPQ